MAEPRFMQAPLADDVPSDNLGPRKPPLFMQAPEAQQEDTGSFFDLAVGVAGEFNQGLLDLLGTPVDLANLALSQVERFVPSLDVSDPRPVGGGRQLREEATGAAPGLFPEPPDTPAGRIAGRVGREVGRSVIPAAGILSTAARVPQAVVRATPSLSQTFFNPIARTPARATAGELAAATGAGAGAGIAREAAPGNTTAELAGELLGGLGPAILATMPSALATRVATNVARRVSPAAQRTRGRQMATELIGQEMSPAAEAGLTAAETLRGEIPGFNPTLGEATNSPALLANQRRLEASASGQALERFAARRQGSEQAIEQFAGRQAPSGDDVTAGDIIGAGGERLQAARGDLAAEIGEVELSRTAVADELRMIDRPEIGQSIRQSISDRKQVVRDEMSQLADELGISDADVSVDYASLRDEILAEFEPGSVFDDLTNVPDAIKAIRDVGPEVPVTFRDLKALRERVSDDLIDAVGRPGKIRKEIRALAVLKERIDVGIDDLTRSADPELARNYEEFRRRYFEDFVTPFEKGAAFGVQKRGSTGFHKTPDEKVAQAFFRAGDVSAARQYRQIFPDNPAALADLEAVALDSLRDAAVRDGVIDPAKVTTWVRNHRSVLDEFPEITGKINNIFEADTALRNRAGDLHRRTKAIDEEILTREIDAFSRGSRTGESVLSSSLSDPRKMRQLIKVVGKERLPELRRLLWREAAAGSPDDMLAFMANNREALSAVFTDRHFSDLSRIVAAKSMLDRTPAPRGSAKTPVPFEDVERTLGQALPQLGSRIFAFKSGRMQRGYLVLDTLLRGARGRAAAGADELLSEALYDPEIARDMITAIDIGRLRPTMAKRLHARLFALPATVTQAEEPEN